MVAMSAMIIEIAQDQLKDEAYRKQHEWVWPDQRKELLSAVPGASEDFQNGYELGLQAARVYLSGNPPAVAAKVNI